RYNGSRYSFPTRRSSDLLAMGVLAIRYRLATETGCHGAEQESRPARRSVWLKRQAASARRETESRKEPLYRGGAVEASLVHAQSSATRAQPPPHSNQPPRFIAYRLWASAIA